MALAWKRVLEFPRAPLAAGHALLPFFASSLRACFISIRRKANGRHHTDTSVRIMSGKMSPNASRPPLYPPPGGPNPDGSRPSLEVQLQHLRQQAWEDRDRRRRIRYALRLQLADADGPEEQVRVLHDHVFPKAEAIHPEAAAAITPMLIRMGDIEFNKL